MDLESLQRDFQSLVTKYVDCEDDKFTRVYDQSHLNDEILPSKTLAGIDRVKIYREMYPLRAQDALEADYPCTSALLEDFWDLVVGYIQEYPSTSFTLDDLGKSFPNYLEKIKGPDIAELARMEQDITVLFDIAEPEKLEAENYSNLKTADNHVSGFRFE